MLLYAARRTGRVTATALASALANAPARCAGCGIKIPLERRQAMPGCRRCADCYQAFRQIHYKREIKS